MTQRMPGQLHPNAPCPTLVQPLPVGDDNRGVPSGTLRIGELSRRTGISVDVIRAWERRYGLLQPDRSDGNYRLYTVHDVGRLRLMQHHLRRGVPPSRAAELVLASATAGLPDHPGIPDGDVRRARGILRDALEGFDDGPPTALLTRLLAVFTPAAVLRDVVLPYLRDIGERWACGEATIAQEHFASAFLRGWMMSMARGWGQRGPRRVLLSCAPGEHHDLGLIAFGLVLRDQGWRITYLGADTPVAALRGAATAVEPDAIVVAAALGPTLAAAGAALQQLAEERTLLVGGAGATDAVCGRFALPCLPQDPLEAAAAIGDYCAETTTA
jgi:MerR family transcriptional regulator, light-induced transcriptional regulator